LIGGNTNAAHHHVGEKAADMIKEEMQGALTPDYGRSKRRRIQGFGGCVASGAEDGFDVRWRPDSRTKRT